MKMYKTNYKDEIKEVEVVKFNDKSVWIFSEHDNKVLRSQRFSKYSSYFETKREAKNYLVDSIERQINMLKSSVERLGNRLEKIINL